MHEDTFQVGEPSSLKFWGGDKDIGGLADLDFFFGGGEWA